MTNAPERKTYAVFARPKNKKLIAELEKSGAAVVRMTPARLSALDDSEFGEALTNIGQFDWLIFADVCAVEFFLEAAQAKDFDLFDLDDIHVCALGEATAERLRLAQIHTDVVPSANTPEKIVESIAEYIFETDGLSGKKFLLLKELNGPAEFCAALESENASVIKAAIYRADFVESGETAKLKALIKGGAIDEILFAAPEDWLHFRFLFNRENPAEILRGVKVSAADEATRQTLGEYNIPAMLLFRG